MSDSNFERRLQAAAKVFPYPPTPDIAAQVIARLERPAAAGRRRWARAALAAVLLMTALAVANPSARAAVLEVLQVQIGAVRILFGGSQADKSVTQVTPSAASGATGLPSPGAYTSTPGTQPGLSSTTKPSLEPSSLPTTTASPTPELQTILSLAEQVSLNDAERRAGFDLRLPSYPPDLGAPSRVFLLELEVPLVILVWDQGPDVRMSLHVIRERDFFLLSKGQPRVVAQTQVDGNFAMWTEGPYYLKVEAGPQSFLLLVEGRVLIWSDGELTYRLESGLEIDEAVLIAESLE